MKVQESWIEVGDVIYIEPSQFNILEDTLRIVTDIKEENDGSKQFILSRYKDESVYTKISMILFLDTWFISDNPCNIRLYKECDQNWIRDKKIDKLI